MADNAAGDIDSAQFDFDHPTVRGATQWQNYKDRLHASDRVI